MHSSIRPNIHIVLRLPSGIHKLLQVQPNSTISIGKYGTFPSNTLIGRPYYITYEIQDDATLRMVPASELHAEALSHNQASASETRDDGAETPATTANDGVEYDIVGENGEVLMRSNRLTIDDPSRQRLSMDEIETLKKAGAGSGKEIIKRIMESHQALDEKTSFSLAKYTLRKSKKYMKRFTVLPLDVNLLCQVLSEREAYRIMEMRVEHLGLISAWLNVHHSGTPQQSGWGDGLDKNWGGRWLVVDDTGGLLVAALAEKMGILYPEEENSDDEASEEDSTEAQLEPSAAAYNAMEVDPDSSKPNDEGSLKIEQQPPIAKGDVKLTTASTTSSPRKRPSPAQSATTNTLTLLHSAAQPNLGLLKNFNFDSSTPQGTAQQSHPLHTHLKTISWLQLLDPESDVSYQEPESLTSEELKELKSGKRGAYWRKRRRWERVKRVVDETRAGGFDGIAIASVMEPATILKHTVPLLRGAGQVVVFSANVEPLTELMDFYSKDRKAAYLAEVERIMRTSSIESSKEMPYEDAVTKVDEMGEDFPVNPTLLLATMLQTSRVRDWQCLPGRTHPVMTSRGGAEGYIFTCTKVIPAERKVQARGKFAKKRKFV